MKNFLICSIFAVLLFFCADAEISHLTGEDRAILAAAFNSTNDFRQAGEILYPYNTNMFLTIAKTDPERRREFAYNVMTNALEFRRSDMNLLIEQGKSGYPDGKLMSIVCGVDFATTQDVAYVEYVADFFGNRFGRDDCVFDLGNMKNLAEHGGRYYTRYEYTKKNIALFYFGSLILRYECLLKEVEIPEFRTNIVVRAKLDDIGISQVWRPETEKWMQRKYRKR